MDAQEMKNRIPPGTRLNLTCPKCAGSSFQVTSIVLEGNMVETTGLECADCHDTEAFQAPLKLSMN